MADRPYHHGELRTALLDTAEALIRERGVDGWSLREASARVGVSPSAAYHHFASRDALVRALARRVLARLGERLADAVERARGDGVDGLVAYGRGYVRWALEDPAVARHWLAYNAGGGDPAAPHPHRVLAAELDRLVETGRLPAAARPGADFVVWAAVHGLAALLVDGLVRFATPEAVDEQVDRVVRATLVGLARQAPPPQGWPEPRSSYTERVTGAGDPGQTG
ncbi:TetR/AcrR family transcriptional regulator [Actinoallomurus rhizosphaericola]|uniref:TetR/AcrR family transcriptional regulator n=1 Tax=Actinoallomurus rhizosphaericola TaxID=2952536 RepID=UPI002093CF5A|nr:TetR/AcrR family transcriptional regulator [Actinoallomurus rhizosphaericola]MCO5997678.1 TetR/AcrR family transcriptional regulator [Actinoallomurus rhizosphaericola]